MAEASEAGSGATSSVVRVNVVLRGGFGEKGGIIVLEEPVVTVSRLMRILGEKYPEAFYSDGSPRPGILVFIDGIDARLLDGGEEVYGDVEVKIIRVFHGG